MGSCLVSGLNAVFVFDTSVFLYVCVCSCVNVFVFEIAIMLLKVGLQAGSTTPKICPLKPKIFLLCNMKLPKQTWAKLTT